MAVNFAKLSMSKLEHNMLSDYQAEPAVDLYTGLDLLRIVSSSALVTGSH